MHPPRGLVVIGEQIEVAYSVYETHQRRQFIHRTFAVDHILAVVAHQLQAVGVLFAFYHYGLDGIGHRLHAQLLPYLLYPHIQGLVCDVCQAYGLAVAHVWQQSVGIGDTDDLALLVVDGGLNDGLSVTRVANDGLGFGGLQYSYECHDV